MLHEQMKNETNLKFGANVLAASWAENILVTSWWFGPLRSQGLTRQEILMLASCSSKSQCRGGPTRMSHPSLQAHRCLHDTCIKEILMVNHITNTNTAQTKLDKTVI